MKNISLLHLHAENFKGINHIDIDFTDFNIVKGKNATGKTTLLDLFWWVLFGKDSQGRTDFQIRPVDGHGQMVDNVEIVGAVTFGIGDYLVTLKKVQTQVWTKKRGETAPTFSGNKNEMWVNGFPVNQKEYEENVAGILDEHLFKLMTNPMAFSMLPWKEQRQILLRFVAEVTDKDVLALDESKYAPIADDILAAGADATRDKAYATLKRLKDEQKSYPIRIDEAMRGKMIISPEADVLARKAKAEADLETIRNERDNLDASLKTYTAIQDEIFNIRLLANGVVSKAKEEYSRQKMAARTAVTEATMKLNSLKQKRDRLNDSLSDNTRSIASIEEDIGVLRKKYMEVKSRVMPADDTTCPTCGREFDADRIAEITDEFEKRKARDLDRVETKGRSARAEINYIKEQMAETHKQIDALTEEIERVDTEVKRLEQASNAIIEPDYIMLPEYQKLNKQLAELSAKLDSVDDGSERRGALNGREELAKQELTLANGDLSVIEANKRADARIEELKAGQMECSQKVADAEQALYLVEEFIKLKMDMLSDRINGHFKKVRFRLFKTLINGGVQPCCVMQMASNGSYVDYPNLNHGAQIIAGLDIIEALGSLYDVSTPVFIDNAEALSSDNQPETSSQLILLCVSDDEELTVINKYK